MPDPTRRLGLGLLLLAVAIFAAERLRVVELLAASMRGRSGEERRRHWKLRATFDRLLGEVRRLSGLAMDTERGFRDRDRALQEMDGIEQRLAGLIKEIRAIAAAQPELSEEWSAAGQVTEAEEERSVP
jgi:hypothetical protein